MEKPTTASGRERGSVRGRVLVVGVPAPDGPHAVHALCGTLRDRLLASDAEVAVLDVAALVDPDAATVEALARVLLTARRLGRTVRLRQPSPRLTELLHLFGLDDVLPTDSAPT
ncbi:STAS domain-containing protein [Egicoccus sp. AB-alg6-2]|uniref:STAS domain-containing protein n=1 Tax=Egicoccus sp. AB-alg6-2 TaxID=3242692 RepID=UPI00359CFFFC